MCDFFEFFEQHIQDQVRLLFFQDILCSESLFAPPWNKTFHERQLSLRGQRSYRSFSI